MLRISLGLVSLLLSTLFAANALGLLPDRDGAVIDGRKSLCEALAIATSLAAQNHDVTALEETVQAIVHRNPDILSASVRTQDGKLLVQVGEPAPSGQTQAAGVSTPTDMFVPISLANQPWGSVEVRFKPVSPGGWMTVLGGPIFPLAVFMLGSGLVLTYFYLRAVLRRPSGRGSSKMIPDRVRATLNTVVEGVLVLDKDQRIALANDAFARTVGKRPEELQGRKACDLPWLASSDENRSVDYPWVRAVREAAPQTGAILGLQTAARRRTMSVNSTPIVGDDGTCRGSLATFDDLTSIEHKNGQLRLMLRRLRRSERQIRRQKEELVQAKEMAEAGSRAKSEFLANVSHEIRTPMNAILGMTEVMLDMPVPDQQLECLEITKASADSLLNVINDLLDFSKIEAGKFSLDPVDFNLPDSLGDTLKMLAVRARKKGLEVLCEMAPGVPTELIGDPGRLRQIIVNLVGNAIKFTEHGSITVTVKPAADETTSSPLLHFAVADTGIGIPAEKLKTVFEPFVQADGSTTRKYGGTGLGLTISSHLVELMGGRIWVESEPDQGSTFHFTARFGLSQTGSQTTPKRKDESRDIPLPPLRILLADDNPFNQRVAVLKLEKRGHRVTVVGCGREALAVLKGEPIDVMLTDIQMPDMDGLEMTAVIRREEEQTGRHLPIIAMTAHAMKGDRERCLNAGMDGYVAKPIQDHELWRAIRDAVPDLHLRASHDGDERETAPLPVSARPGVAVGHLNAATALARVGDNRELFQELVGVFRQDCSGLLTQLQEAVAQQEAGQVMSAAHTLKGMVSFFAAVKATEAALRLEQMGRAGTLLGAEDQLAELRSEIAGMQAELAELCAEEKS